MRPILTVKEVALSLGSRRIFRDLSMNFERGEIHLLTGDNGTGKTSFVRAALGLIPLSSGIVSWDIGNADVEIRPGRMRRGLSRDLYAHVGYVSQRMSLWPHLTIRQTVAQPLIAKGRPMKDALEAAEHQLTEFDVPKSAWDQLPVATTYNGRRQTLSGGEAQRVIAARAMVADPELLILDEVETSLDFTSSARVIDIVARGFMKKGGKTALVITHSPERWEPYSPRIYAFIKEGDRVALGPAREPAAEKGQEPLTSVSPILTLMREMAGLSVGGLKRDASVHAVGRKLASAIYRFLSASLRGVNFIVTVSGPAVYENAAHHTTPTLYGVAGPPGYSPTGKDAKVIQPFLEAEPGQNWVFPAGGSAAKVPSDNKPLVSGLIWELIVGKDKEDFPGKCLFFEGLDNDYTLEYFKFSQQDVSNTQTYLELDKATKSVYLLRGTVPDGARLILGIDISEEIVIKRSLQQPIGMAMAMALEKLES